MDLINTILIIGGLGLIVYALLLAAHMEDIKSKPRHHDQAKGSYYDISQQVKRDQRKERGYS